MFYDHLSAHSLLAKLGRWGWLMRMELAWKKSQKTLDTSKRLHQNKTRSTGSAGQRNLFTTLLLLGLRTRESAGASRLKAPSGGAKCPNTFFCCTYNRVFNWLLSAILDVRNSLSIAFLTTLDQYRILLFWKILTKMGRQCQLSNSSEIFRWIMHVSSLRNVV